ncbi:hypothetical protein RHA1_ro06968 [Rhodococcus jostii RHA1]|uniref:Uncharacterized protein n=1 Tax=Rhodococcus jostii (strain RHA1) TaxID=101510 RepID=Q0S152_RHOJR|nr:hypothetical protein RHA1_ro06968 [Rhodococcus jostii RHA1]
MEEPARDRVPGHRFDVEARGESDAGPALTSGYRHHHLTGRPGAQRWYRGAVPAAKTIAGAMTADAMAVCTAILFFMMLTSF